MVQDVLEGELIVPDASGVAVTDDVIDEVAAAIRDMQHERGLKLAYDIGKLVVDRFYGGDIEELHRRGAKDASLRKLAEHPALDRSRSWLHQSIGIYALVERRGGVHTCGHLGSSHVRAVLALPHKDQDKLLEKAQEQGWTVKELEAEAKKVHEHTKQGKGGRPALPRFVKSVHALKRFVDEGDDLFGDLDQVDELDDDEATLLYQTITGLKLKCEELQGKLQPKVPGFTRRPAEGDAEN